MLAIFVRGADDFVAGLAQNFGDAIEHGVVEERDPSHRASEVQDSLAFDWLGDRLSARLVRIEHRVSDRDFGGVGGVNCQGFLNSWSDLDSAVCGLDELSMVGLCNVRMRRIVAKLDKRCFVPLLASTAAHLALYGKILEIVRCELSILNVILGPQSWQLRYVSAFGVVPSNDLRLDHFVGGGRMVDRTVRRFRNVQ